MACVFAHIDLVKVLIENRADVQAKIVVRSDCDDHRVLCCVFITSSLFGLGAAYFPLHV